jgi:hypothetical protein
MICKGCMSSRKLGGREGVLKQGKSWISQDYTGRVFSFAMKKTFPHEWTIQVCNCSTDCLHLGGTRTVNDKDRILIERTEDRQNFVKAKRRICKVMSHQTVTRRILAEGKTEKKKRNKRIQRLQRYLPHEITASGWKKSHKFVLGFWSPLHWVIN